MHFLAAMRCRAGHSIASVTSPSGLWPVFQSCLLDHFNDPTLNITSQSLLGPVRQVPGPKAIICNPTKCALWRADRPDERLGSGGPGCLCGSNKKAIISGVT